MKFDPNQNGFNLMTPVKMWVFPKIVVPAKMIHFNRVFGFSIIFAIHFGGGTGTPIFGKHQYVSLKKNRVSFDSIICPRAAREKPPCHSTSTDGRTEHSRIDGVGVVGSRGFRSQSKGRLPRESLGAFLVGGWTNPFEKY